MFDINLEAILKNDRNAFAQAITRDQPLKSSRPEGSPPNFTMFKMGELLMRVPSLNNPAEILKEGLIPDLEAMFSKVQSMNEGGVTPEGSPDGGTYEGSMPPAGTDKSGLGWGGYQNGKIPQSALKKVNVAGVNHYFMHQGGEAFERMMAAAAQDGVKLTLTDSYRSYELQVDVKRRKPNLAATPGKSNHGWGRAIDASGAACKKWIQSNGYKFGWIWPDWARPTGSRPEDWHFEYRPSVHAPANIASTNSKAS